MEVIRSGFDKLELSLNVVASPELCEVLTAAREYARSKPNAIVGAYFNGLDLIVRSHGAPGGYAYVFETDALPANWFLKDSAASSGWGARVAVRALPLVLYGLNWVKAELDKTIELLGLKVPPNGFSISRVDYAVDCLLPDFELKPENFVIHSSTNLHRYYEPDEMLVAGKSWRPTSVRIGGITRKQIGVYDKLRQVRQLGKPEMYEIWDAIREDQGERPLVYSGEGADSIWRVELRAGKEYLKERWQVTGWGSLVEHLPEFLAEIMKTMRYAEPTSDNNRSRWPNHPLWDLVAVEIAQNAMRHLPSVDLERVLYTSKAAKIEWFEANMLGNAISHAALTGVTSDGMADHLVWLSDRLRQLNEDHRVSCDLRLEQARDRYRGLLARFNDCDS
jgi:hypothetical protein